jgi:glycosyltransferase involved in cell wall biosynthesis
MKLLYITNGVDASGGLERVLALKASYLAEHFNYEVTILTLNSHGKSLFYEFVDKIKFYNIKAKGSSIVYYLAYRKGIKNAIREIKPDVISVCDDGLKGLLFPFVFGKKIPTVYERHASVDLNFFTDFKMNTTTKFKNYWSHKLMLFGARQFSEFVVLTNGNKFDWNGVNTTVIPNPNPFEVDFSSMLNKDRTVLAVGSQTFNKGYDRLLKAWEVVHKKHPSWLLKVYGKKNEKLGLELEVDRLKLNDHVVFKNPINDIQVEYNKASIFVLPSRSEGFGMVLIEAMSFGLPCISFNCPHGPADIIKQGQDGFLIQNGDIEAFAKAILNLIENEELRIHMGEKAKENVQSYKTDAIMPLWDNLFTSLIKAS